MGISGMMLNKCETAEAKNTSRLLSTILFSFLANFLQRAKKKMRK
jgi:hypothetical protein